MSGSTIAQGMILINTNQSRSMSTPEIAFAASPAGRYHLERDSLIVAPLFSMYSKMLSLF